MQTDSNGFLIFVIGTTTSRPACPYARIHSMPLFCLCLPAPSLLPGRILSIRPPLLQPCSNLVITFTLPQVKQRTGMIILYTSGRCRKTCCPPGVSTPPSVNKWQHWEEARSGKRIMSQTQSSVHNTHNHQKRDKQSPSYTLAPKRCGRAKPPLALASP